MIDELFIFFYSKVFNVPGYTGNGLRILFGTTTSLGLTYREYFATLCAIVSMVIILVLCCLFIYRLIRLVGRLFSGGAL